VTCCKCGSDDVLTRWHERADFDHPRSYWMNCRDESEHLHHYCRSCQYGWTSPTLDSGASSAGTAKEGA
jgi:hypothetical protein